jgi:serine/threonine-protein kinase
MSPEQITRSSALDARSDLFSLGVMLIELISGVHPFAPQGFASENVYTLVRRIVGEPLSLRALAPGAPAYVADVLDRVVMSEPARRFPDARALRDALDAALITLERAVGPVEPLTTLAAVLAQGDGAPNAADIALCQTEDAAAADVTHPHGRG